MLSVPAGLVCLGAVFALLLAATWRRVVAGENSTSAVSWALAFWAPAFGILVIGVHALVSGWTGADGNALEIAGYRWRGDEPGYMLILAGFGYAWRGTRAFYGKSGRWWLVGALIATLLALQPVFGGSGHGAALVRELYLLLGAALFLHLAVIELENGRCTEPLKSAGDAILVCKSFSFTLVAVVPFAVWQPLTLRALGDGGPVWLFAWLVLVLIHLVAAPLVALQLARERADLRLHVFRTEDELTGLNTRHAFIEAVEADLKRDDHFAGAFLVLQVDDFREITDNHGRKDGDLVLVAFAGFLRTVAGETMTCARLGEAEFGLYIPGLAGKPVELLAQQLCLGTCLLKPELDEKPFSLSVSIGFSDTERSGRDFDTLYAHANCGLHEARRRGGNGCCAYSPDLKVKDFQSSMRKALRLIA